MSDAAKPKPAKITSAKEFVAAQSRQTETVAEAEKTSTQTDASRFADIKSNPFYQVMLDEARTPQEKLDVVTQALTFADDRQKGEGNACGVQQFQGVPAV